MTDSKKQQNRMEIKEKIPNLIIKTTATGERPPFQLRGFMRDENGTTKLICEVSQEGIATLYVEQEIIEQLQERWQKIAGQIMSEYYHSKGML